MDKDEITWVDQFNPLAFIMQTWIDAGNEKSGQYTREFSFQTRLTDKQLYDYKVVWYYFAERLNTPDKRQVMMLINDNLINIVCMVDTNGISNETYEKYSG